MRVEEIKIPDTAVVLATIIFYSPHVYDKDLTEFITDPSRSIQVGVLHRRAQTRVECHQHLPKQKTVNGCQEVLIIKSGMLHVDIYDPDKNYICTRVLRTGDILIQYWGGHAFEFLNDTVFIELKQGPYTPEDKVFFNPLAHEQMK